MMLKSFMVFELMAYSFLDGVYEIASSRGLLENYAVYNMHPVVKEGTPFINIWHCV
jgi:hypothetical protein